MGSPESTSREDNEQRSVDEVIDRLAKKFPQLDREEIRRIVDEEHHAFDGRPVRDFVPVLVEKGAKRRIKRGLDAA
ncbi:three-helix bundle dimerization domain-containing protein [Agromyces sp. SYSU T00266]|uniref:three-helix bundle dimerization domain-containing protein n=1 Tax=Agromyces zhanjiangensis TaxID=3158562 RepID=UPI003397A684